MKATICATGGRVNVEPVAGGNSVLLSVRSDAGEQVSVLLDLSAGGAILFAIENALEVVDMGTVRNSTRDAESAAVRAIAP